MPDEFDDIMGSHKTRVDPPAKRPGRPPKIQLEERKEVSGLTVKWLAENFNMPRATVIDRLKECPIKGRHPVSAAPLYDLKTAAAYLVDFVYNTKAMKAVDLPEKLRESFWNAKIKEMKFKVLAGELWPTESVMEVLADTFQLISGKTKLWVDDLEEVTQLNDEQRRYLQTMVDDLIAEIRKSLLARAESKVTESYIAEMDS